MPKYIELDKKLHRVFGASLVTIGEIADVICGPFGSSITNKDYQKSGIPLVRITNISKDGYMDYKDLIYISEELGNSLSRTQVSKGDIVISQRGSLGQCAIIDATFPKLNISANIIAVKNPKGISADFIHNYILSVVGQTLLERASSGQVQQKITTQDIANLLIPIGCDEQKLADIIEAGHTEYKKKTHQSEKLLRTCKDKIFSSLNLNFCEYKPALFSISKFSDLRELGIYCNPHSDYLNHVFSKLRANDFFAGHLEDFVEVNPKTSRKLLHDQTAVSFVPMTAVTEKTNEVVYEIKTYNEVKTGFTIFQRGDLLWAKITPCMQNGKSFIASNMPTDIGFGSTEFHVLRAKDNKSLYIPYLWVILSNEHILEAAQGMFGGSAGQQRVPDTFLKKFPIVLPPYTVQVKLADYVLSTLEKVKMMRQEAEQDWQTAKEQFEKELLGE